jgi:IQ domain-containing protein G
LYEQVVRDDRAAKERRRRQLEREEQQMNAAVRIQAWWRGMLVRNAIGPHRKKKGKKGKKKKK